MPPSSAFWWVGAAAARLGLAAAFALVLFHVVSLRADGEPQDPGPPPPAPLAGVFDLSGKPIDPFADRKAKAVALIFISLDCPISNRYAPEIQRLEKKFAPQGAHFWLVQPDTDDSVDKTRKHLSDFGYSMGLLRDSQRALVKLTGATVTPEAAVFGPKRELLYLGRIDNRFADYGKARPAPTSRELHDTLEAVMAGRPAPTNRAPAIGCYIPK